MLEHINRFHFFSTIFFNCFSYYLIPFFHIFLHEFLFFSVDVSYKSHGIPSLYSIPAHVWSSLSGWYFFNEIPDLKTIIGILLIVCGGIYIFIREKVQDQPIVTEKPLR